MSERFHWLGEVPADLSLGVASAVNSIIRFCTAWWLPLLCFAEMKYANTQEATESCLRPCNVQMCLSIWDSSLLDMPSSQHANVTSPSDPMFHPQTEQQRLRGEDICVGSSSRLSLKSH